MAGRPVAQGHRGEEPAAGGPAWDLAPRFPLCSLGGSASPARMGSPGWAWAGYAQDTVAVWPRGLHGGAPRLFPTPRPPPGSPPEPPCLPETLSFSHSAGFGAWTTLSDPRALCVLVTRSHLSAEPGAGLGPRLHSQRCPLTEGGRASQQTGRGAPRGSATTACVAGQVARLAERHWPHGVTERKDVKQRQVPGPGPAPAV